jgi:hypothetical protein
MKATLSVSIAFIASNLWFSPTAVATEQIPEAISIGGKQQQLFSEPLYDYLQLPTPAKKFKTYIKDLGACSALWRQYVGQWEIKNKQLYLIDAEVTNCSITKKIPLLDLFPGKRSPILATWYSGSLAIPQGKQIASVRGGYGGIFERYKILDVKKGIIIKEKTISARQFEKSFK